MVPPTATLRDLLITAYLERRLIFQQFLTRRLRSRDIAEEALQETWLRLDAMRSDSDYVVRDRQAFVLRVANNIAIDILRRERLISSRHLNDEALLVELADQSPSAETVVSDRQQLRELGKALAKLPPKAREALLLSRADGLTHAQIADRLGVTSSMVAKYLAQALRVCRDYFRLLDGQK